MDICNECDISKKLIDFHMYKSGVCNKCYIDNLFAEKLEATWQIDSLLNGDTECPKSILKRLDQFIDIREFIISLYEQSCSYDTKNKLLKFYQSKIKENFDGRELRILTSKQYCDRYDHIRRVISKLHKLPD
jgi:hypothetical protein